MAPKPTEEPSSVTPRAILAYGSAAIVLLGLGLLAYDVFTHELRHTGLWALLAGAVGLVASAIWRSMDEADGLEPTLAEPAVSTHGEGPYRSGVSTTASALPRHASTVLIVSAVVLLVQALIPLRYYLGDDGYDERFSWRMFSAVRMHACSLSAFETRNGTEQPVSLQRQIQVGWITTLERNREAVMERYLRWRCEQEGIEAVRLENRCRTPEGREVPLVLRALDCRTDEYRREGGLQ
jgi:hypothetical protein